MRERIEKEIETDQDVREQTSVKEMVVRAEMETGIEIATQKVERQGVSVEKKGKKKLKTRSPIKEDDKTKLATT